MKNAYKEGDFVELMTRQPGVHVQVMFGYGQVPLDDIKEEKYVGRIKTVIGNGTSFLIRSLSPLDGFYCVEDAEKIIRKLDDNEITDEMQSKKEPPHYTAPNVFINKEPIAHLGVSVEMKCIMLARVALATLFPDEDCLDAELIPSDYNVDGAVAFLDEIQKAFYNENCSMTLAEVEETKKRVVKEMRTKRFKEYYCVQIALRDTNIPGNEGQPAGGIVPRYIIAVVDHNFEVVSILRNRKERSAFEMSLGPEFDDVYQLANHFKNRLLTTKEDKEGEK